MRSRAGRPGPGSRRPALVSLGAAFIAAVVLTTHREDAWLFDGGYTLVALASALVICTALNERSALARLLAARPARELGRLSCFDLPVARADLHGRRRLHGRA
ncbi:MAG: hypothetical protein QOE15_1808, partial [Acidimicrobiaceae bacterium]|nr:hypothetical protein [Acidimicrobiaceae bacterium]